MGAVEVKRILNLVPKLLEVPYPRIWTSYGKEADVLCINFKKLSHADDSELTDDDIIISCEKGETVGITILNASKKEGRTWARHKMVWAKWFKDIQIGTVLCLITDNV